MNLFSESRAFRCAGRPLAPRAKTSPKGRLLLLNQIITAATFGDVPATFSYLFIARPFHFLFLVFTHIFLNTVPNSCLSSLLAYFVTARPRAPWALKIRFLLKNEFVLLRQ